MIDSEYEIILNHARFQFDYYNKELVKVFYSLNAYDNKIHLDIKETGVYKHVKKLIPCLDILYNVSLTDSIQSLLTLQRMIVDNYAVLFLLTSFSSKDEQLLRYYLYLLDAVQSRSMIIDNFSSNLTTVVPDEVVQNAKDAKDSDQQAIIGLKKLINDKHLDTLVNNKILIQNNWKFIKADSADDKRKNSYSWIDLYKKSKLPSNHSYVIQNYHSSYVHGLGISLMSDEKSQYYPIIIYTLDTCSIIQALTIRILISEFPQETKSVKLNDDTVAFMNDIWNDK